MVHTDHLNLLYKKLASEEFGPEFKHVQGVKNMVADALSRLDLEPKSQDEVQDTKTNNQLSYVNQTDMEEILEDVFPMSPREIRQHQKKDEKLLKSLQEHKDYDTKRIKGKDLIMYKKRIYIPNSLKDRVMEWYHTYLVHPGTTRMLSTI